MYFLKTLFYNDNCGGLGQIVNLVKDILGVALVIIGVALVVLLVIDIAKAIIASEEKEVKGYQKAAIRRVIYFVVIFFIVILVNAIMKLVSGSTNEDTTSWFKCWSDPIDKCEDANNDNKCDK